jgi:5-oxoprolinase (ATP-hydrolysing) subunit A
VTAPSTIDLNADLGEGDNADPAPDDAALLEIISSANVACGAHAGDENTMRRTCERAAALGVAIGAHVSYRDRAAFGRRFVEVEAEALAADLAGQIALLDGIARSAGTRVSYVKPHGALYNAIVDHETPARCVVDAALGHGTDLAVMGLPGSAVLRLADEAGLRTIGEAFADRAYTATGSLVPRGQAGAVVHDVDEVVARTVRLALAGEVVAIDGTVVPVDAASICVHGDTPGAVVLARSVRSSLLRAGVAVGPVTW